MRLIEALRYTQPASIAFVGAGGKTTAMFRAAREIIESQAGERQTRTVVVTTSTHLGDWQAKQADHHFIVTSLEAIERVWKELPGGVVLISSEVKNHLLGGLTSLIMDELHKLTEENHVPQLIEADGAHTRPLKAPEKYEPAIPDFTHQVVVVAGMSGLGKPLTSEWVHRPEKFTELSGLPAGEAIDEQAVMKVLLDKRGGLKGIPCGARKSVLLNQADTVELQSQAMTIGEKLLPGYDACIIASLAPDGKGTSYNEGSEIGWQKEVHAVKEAIAGIVLAGGGSSRFGTPKQLLTWKGAAFVRQVAYTALKAGLNPVIVVVGSNAAEVSDAVRDLAVRIVNNDDWKRGMSTSIKAGLRALAAGVGGAIFMQADQPQIPPTLIRSLVEAHETTLGSIIAPQIDGQRGNPVLFDARTFAKLLSLEGDTGGRALFSSYPVEWLSWQDARLLMDVDSPEDYLRLQEYYPESGAKL